MNRVRLVIANARPAPPIAAGLRQRYQDPDPLRAWSASRSPGARRIRL